MNGWHAAYRARYAQLKKEGVPFFPDVVFKDAVTAVIVFAALAGLAWFVGAGLEDLADPTDATYNPRPEWYFLFMFQTLKLIPSKVWLVDGEVLGILGCSLAGLLWLLLPFFESDQPARTKAWITGLSIFALVYVVGMSVYGFLAQ